MRSRESRPTIGHGTPPAEALVRLMFSRVEDSEPGNIVPEVSEVTLEDLRVVFPGV
jgi:hypothetical protein